MLIVVGCVQFVLSRRYANAARQEATTAGVISHITGGRTTTYDYVFKIDGVQLYDDSSSCHTALTPKGCKVGAPVLVYYAHLPVLETRLQEFGEASREKLFTSIGMVSAGFLLITLFFILKKTRRDSDQLGDVPDGDRENPDSLHVVSSK